MKKVLLLLILLLSSISVFPHKSLDKRLKNLVLTAKVLEVKKIESNEESISYSVKLGVAFTNKGSVPIIILHSLDERDHNWWSGITVWVATRYGDFPVFNNGVLPSVCGSCYDEIKNELNKNIPPERYAKILKPQESWKFTDKQNFTIDLKAKKDQYGFEEELFANKWKVSGSIGYSLLPNNLGEKFRENLKRRWQKYGVLYFHETHSWIDSEKFEIDLTNVKL